MVTSVWPFNKVSWIPDVSNGKIPSWESSPAAPSHSLPIVTVFANGKASTTISKASPVL